MPGLHDLRSKRTREIVRQVLSGAGLFDVEQLEVSYRRGAFGHQITVRAPGYSSTVSVESALDLPSYPEMIEAAHDHQVRHAPKPPRRKKSP